MQTLPKKSYASKLSPAKAECWESHAKHKTATKHPKPLLFSKQPYSLSISQPSFPIPRWTLMGRKGWVDANSPRIALRLNWAEWESKAQAFTQQSEGWTEKSEPTPCRYFFGAQTVNNLKKMHFFDKKKLKIENLTCQGVLFIVLHISWYKMIRFELKIKFLAWRFRVHMQAISSRASRLKKMIFF